MKCEMLMVLRELYAWGIDILSKGLAALALWDPEHAEAHDRSST